MRGRSVGADLGEISTISLELLQRDVGDKKTDWARGHLRVPSTIKH